MRNLPVLEMTFPFPVMAPISSNILVWIPFPEIFHLVRSPNWQSAITGTGCDSFHTISGTGGTGLCHFRNGHSLGPILELDSMCVVDGDNDDGDGDYKPNFKIAREGGERRGHE